MFRILVLLGLAVMLLPNDPRSREELVSSSASAIRYTMTFCDRNPDYCEKAAQIRSEFARKAHAAADVAARAIKDALDERVSGGNVRRESSIEPTRYSAYERGTLTREDTSTQWRAPGQRSY